MCQKIPKHLIIGVVMKMKYQGSISALLVFAIEAASGVKKFNLPLARNYKKQLHCRAMGKFSLIRLGSESVWLNDYI